MGKTWEAQTQILPRPSAVPPFKVPEGNTSKEPKSIQIRVTIDCDFGVKAWSISRESQWTTWRIPFAQANDKRKSEREGGFSPESGTGFIYLHHLITPGSRAQKETPYRWEFKGRVHTVLNISDQIISLTLSNTPGSMGVGGTNEEQQLWSELPQSGPVCRKENRTGN